GGLGLGRGYLNQPALTAQRFVPNPFPTPEGGVPSARLYRTGDLVRWDNAGELDYLGRLDEQVKIRGFRIELGEIEQQLMAEPEVQVAVVQARDDGPAGKRLVAYLTPAAGMAGAQDVSPAWTEALRERLATRLPGYMVPAQFVVLAQLPMTANGKIDRQALPAPPAVTAVQAFIAPANEMEQALAEIWGELLGLPVAQISAAADFFSLGGHSLLAIRLVVAVKARLGLAMEVRDLFAHPRLSALASTLSSLSAATRPPLQPRTDRTAPLPLSHAQQRLWFLDRLSGGSAHYNIPLALHVKGALDLDRAEQALARLIERHETLRTIFHADGETVQQQVQPTVSFAIRRHDARHLPRMQALAWARQLAAEDAARPFDLARDLMLRASHIAVGPEEGVLLLALHHIAADGWSLQVLTEQFLQLYQGLADDPALRLPPLAVQYGDFAVWQRRWLQGEALQAQLGYWRQTLSDLPPVHELRLDRPRPAQPAGRGARVALTLPQAALQALRQLAARHEATLFMALHAAVCVLLTRHGAGRDIVIGTPVANRTDPALQPLIGFFVNTLVLRLDCDLALSYTDLLQRAKAVHLQAQAHQDLPFELLVEQLRPVRSPQFSPLFQIAFSMGLPGPHAPTASDPAGLLIEPLGDDTVTAKYDLTFHASEGAEGLHLSIDYDVDLFEPTRMQTLVRHWARLLDTLVATPGAPVQGLPMLDDDERRQLLHTVNATAADAWAGQTLVSCFEAQVRHTPDGLALWSAQGSLNYGALEAQANRLANRLRALGVGPGVVVAMLHARGINMILSQLAILKAGGAYLPLDPAYPAQRLVGMLEDGGVQRVVTDTALLPLARAVLAAPDSTCVCADEDLSAWPAQPPGVAVSPQDLAYVIYTSGSTGRPKGVMITHEGACNLAAFQRERFDIGPGDQVL
ncbi:MAG: AMP-binding protein, partial [Pelomonas sp.]|nr:AMP-binding protein [Roseateles sp.]